MDIPQKSFENGFTVPVYGLGTWEMGGVMAASHDNDAAHIDAIRRAIDSGVTHVDTAKMYGDGHCEELVGAAIKPYHREKLFIATKLTPEHQGYDDVKTEFEGSLDRLGTSYIDLYMLHRYPKPGVSVPETLRALNELVDDGKIKYIGACNFTVEMLEEARRYSKHPIVCNQVHYSLACREIVDKGVLEYCQAHSIAVIAWGPLELGKLERYDMLERIAAQYQKTPYQVALNWLVAQKNVATVCKTENPLHIEENLGALGWSLSDESMADLTNNFPDQFKVSDRVPLDYPSAVGEA